MADYSIKLPVKVNKDVFAPKVSQWRVRLDHIVAYGRTIKDAVDEVTRLTLLAIERLDTEPAFARDDDGSLIVAVQKSHGVEHFRVTGDVVRCITSTCGTPIGSLRSTRHYTVLDDDQYD